MLILLLFWIKFGKTKQIVVALVTTTFNVLLAVAKTTGRFSGHEFYAGNIYRLFGNNFTHTFTSSAYKKCAPKGTHRKNASLSLLLHKCPTQRRYEEKEKTLFTKSIFPSLVRTYAICVTSIFYHISVGLSIKLENLTKILLLLLWCL